MAFGVVPIFQMGGGGVHRVASDYSAVMYVYVGIVGWIYRTKIDPISILVSLLF